MSKEEALQYLKLRKIDEEQAARIYELIGGCMIHLKSIADEIKNSTLEGMCTACYAETGLVSHLLYSCAQDDLLRRRTTRIR